MRLRRAAGEWPRNWTNLPIGLTPGQQRYRGCSRASALKIGAGFKYRSRFSRLRPLWAIPSAVPRRSGSRDCTQGGASVSSMCGGGLGMARAAATGRRDAARSPRGHGSDAHEILEPIGTRIAPELNYRLWRRLSARDTRDSAFLACMRRSARSNDVRKVQVSSNQRAATRRSTAPRIPAIICRPRRLNPSFRDTLATRSSI